MSTIDIKFTLTAKRTYNALNEGWPIIVNEGGARCFAGSQNVFTLSGSKPISKIEVGEFVLTSGERYKRVSAVHKMKNDKPTVRIKLKNGKQIICTEDHKFFFSGRWVEIKYLLSLVNV